MSQPSPDAKAVVRAAEALTTQVRRIADALSTPVVKYKVAVDDAGTQTVIPICNQPGPWGDAHTCIRPADHDDDHEAHDGCGWRDGPTTPATTCSARYAGALVVGDCIRAAGHIPTTDHTDASGRHYGDDLAVYPLPDSTVKVAHWRPVAEQHAEERQELAGMVGEFIDAQMRMAPVSDEETERTARRESIGILISRAGRGVITGSESELLRQWVETEIREAKTAREVARGNLRHVREIVPELEKAQAAIERVRALVVQTAQAAHVGKDDHTIGRYDMAVAVLEALDGTEQPPAGCVPGPYDDCPTCPHDATEQPTTDPGFTEQHANPDIIGTTEGP